MARGDDEVTVDEGDEVIILDDAKSEEWWMVRRLKNGKEGVVPANYVEITSYVASREDPGVLQVRSHGIKNTQEDVPSPSTSRQVVIEEIDRDVLEVETQRSARTRSLPFHYHFQPASLVTIAENNPQNISSGHYSSASPGSNVKELPRSLENRQKRDRLREEEIKDEPMSWRARFDLSSSDDLLSSVNEENHNRLQQQPKDRAKNLSEEEDYSEREPRFFDDDGILDTRYIPWDRFPDISRLRVFSKRHLDRGDGERFTADELDHVESLLVHTCRDLSCPRSLTDHNPRQITHLGGMGRICLILDLIEQRQLLRDFIWWKIADDSLPLLIPILQHMLGPHEDGERTAERFFTEQFRAVSRDWSKGAHHVMHRREALPFRPLRSIGFGSQGSIDEVQLPNTEGTCARKKWLAGANLQKITARFDDEVKIIKKVAAHPHILELLASYMRGREFRLLLPVADCDLWHILTMNPSEREDFIPNQKLIQSWGCLSSGLLFMHDKGIKHKDIKPQNIVLRQGGFQFTDFGLSKDISDLSHSATDSADRGTFRYMAPEVTDYQPQGRAADVFSLACVLFEVFSVWGGISVDDVDSFSALAPFHKNLSAIHSWIGEFAPITPLSLLRYKKSKSIFGAMLTHNPVDRPQMREVVFKMTMVSYPGDLFCNRCLDVALRRSEEPEVPKMSKLPEGLGFRRFSSMLFA